MVDKADFCHWSPGEAGEPSCRRMALPRGGAMDDALSRGVRSKEDYNASV